MQATSVLNWLRERRVLAFVVALVLVLTVAVGLVIGNSTNTAAAADDAAVELVADDDLTLAGPSWTWFSRGGGDDPGFPPIFFGPSWG